MPIYDMNIGPCVVCGPEPVDMILVESCILCDITMSLSKNCVSCSAYTAMLYTLNLEQLTLSRVTSAYPHQNRVYSDYTAINRLRRSGNNIQQ